MNIKLKEISRDDLKVGDTVGIARMVNCGWLSTFRHRKLFRLRLQESLQKEPRSKQIYMKNMEKTKSFTNTMKMPEKKMNLRRSLFW